MSIEIDAAKCLGCGRCADICPGGVIRVAGGRAELPRPERCWGCAACVKECPVQAAALFLGADIGGLGGRMTARREGPVLRWTVRLPDGGEWTMAVDGRRPNQY